MSTSQLPEHSVQQPSLKRKTPPSTAAGCSKSARRKAWTNDETKALIAGVKRHGHGNWKEILTDTEFAPFLIHCSNLDIKSCDEPAEDIDIDSMLQLIQKILKRNSRAKGFIWPLLNIMDELM